MHRRQRRETKVFGSELARNVPSRRGSRQSKLARRVLPLALVLAGSVVASALASGGALTIGSASNSRLGKKVVVNAQGHTLYALNPETATNLLCKSSECMKFWPPLTVGSTTTTLKDGPGLHGHLTILRRRDGLLQVTLRGMPLYRYSRDHAKGQAKGEGIESFGGTWHAVAAASAKSTTPSPTTPSPSPLPSPTPMTPAY
jgi:predicted lipoprotein with Yx(FWY)xxD motif